MASDLHVRIIGVDEVKAALTAVEARVDRATVAAIKATSKIAAKAVRAQITGRPRWDHRGKSTRTGAGVSLHLDPHHEARGGGPGNLTGKLRRGVGYVKRPRRRGAGTYVGGVGVGGGPVTNNYKGTTEERYPYMKPGMRRAEPSFPAVWEAAWSAAVHKK